MNRVVKGMRMESVILRMRAFKGTSKRIAIAITLVLGKWLHVIGTIARENGIHLLQR